MYIWKSVLRKFCFISGRDRSETCLYIFRIGIIEAGKIVQDCWFDLPNHYKNICLDEFIIMPDHIHGIIIFKNTNDNRCRHGLPEIMRALKSFASRKINLNRDEHEAIWQPGYYDHVIKTDNELDRIRKYIRNNFAEWIKNYPEKS